MYYNPQWGVVTSQGAGTTKKLNSCLRYDNYYSDVDLIKLGQEALVFGTELRSILVIPVSDDTLSAAIALTIERLNKEIRYEYSFETWTNDESIWSFQFVRFEPRQFRPMCGAKKTPRRFRGLGI